MQPAEQEDVFVHADHYEFIELHYLCWVLWHSMVVVCIEFIDSVR